jgi:hypothetical protein
MAASTTGFPIAATAIGSAATATSSNRRRISPEAGRALEILGHAIEYMTDEYVHQGNSLNAGDAQVKAVQLMMALNRQIYFDCPVIPSIADRFRAFLARRLSLGQ